MSTPDARHKATAERILEVYEQMLQFLRELDVEPYVALAASAKLVVRICECSDKPDEIYANTQKFIGKMWLIARHHAPETEAKATP